MAVGLVEVTSLVLIRGSLTRETLRVEERAATDGVVAGVVFEVLDLDSVVLDGARLLGEDEADLVSVESVIRRSASWVVFDVRCLVVVEALLPAKVGEVLLVAVDDALVDLEDLDEAVVLVVTVGDDSR